MWLNFDVDRNYFWLEGYSRLSLIDRQFDTTRERYLQFRGEGCSWSLFILGMIKVQIIIFDSCKIRDYMKVFQNPHFGWPDNYWEGDHLFLNLLLAVLKVLGKRSTISTMQNFELLLFFKIGAAYILSKEFQQDPKTKLEVLHLHGSTSPGCRCNWKYVLILSRFWTDKFFNSKVMTSKMQGSLLTNQTSSRV